MNKVLRLVIYIAGLYLSFIYWGVLKERLTSTKYSRANTDETELGGIKWSFPVVINCFQAFLATALIIPIQYFVKDKSKTHSFKGFRKVAILSIAASWIGYFSLKYISFPTQLITSTAKPVPLMIIGAMFYGQYYSITQCLSVITLFLGCILFQYGEMKHHTLYHQHNNTQDISIFPQVIGIISVLINLFIDGIINNEEDYIYKIYNISSFEMMKQVSWWQYLILSIYLTVMWIWYGEQSELYGAVNAWMISPGIRYDTTLLCISQSIGQVLIFATIQEFGSLTWITVSVTRKLLAVLLSVFLFKHHIDWIQWVGVLFAFPSAFWLNVVKKQKRKIKPSAVPMNWTGEFRGESKESFSNSNIKCE